MAIKSTKKRNWAFVLYPESAPSDWRDFLQQTGLQCAVSPLHDKDINPDGEPKKAHYHIILVYSGPTSYSVVSKLTDILGQPAPQPLEQIRGYYRYLTHEDNPEKYQYDKLDITTINGFNIGDFVELTRTEIDKILTDIQKYIIFADIREYSDLCDCLLEYNRDWHSVAIHNAMFLNSYLKSRRYKLMNEGIHKLK